MNSVCRSLCKCLLYIIEQITTYETLYLVYCFCTALVGTCFSVRAGSRPCGQAVLGPLDGQRWTAETDGIAHCVLTAFQDARKMKNTYCSLLKHSSIPFSSQPMCDNHDDGETAAIILCNVCGNLCTDCDRFLHLHRRTRSHQRQVCFHAMTGKNNKKILTETNLMVFLTDDN